MTRINLHMPIAQMTNEHIFAEYREMSRVPNTVIKRLHKTPLHKLIKEVPKEFKMGTGHVKYFYDKLLYLKKRHYDLHDAVISNGYKLSEDLRNVWDQDLPIELMNDINPDKPKKILIDRIIERILSAKEGFYHYKGSEINKDNYCDSLRLLV